MGESKTQMFLEPDEIVWLSEVFRAMEAGDQDRLRDLAAGKTIDRIADRVDAARKRLAPAGRNDPMRRSMILDIRNRNASIRSDYQALLAGGHPAPEALRIVIERYGVSYDVARATVRDRSGERKSASGPRAA